MKEEMKDIVGYEGKYAITRDGRIWSYKRKKYLKPFNNGRGYYMINLYKNGKKKNFQVHRLVAQAFIPNHDNLPVVNHKDECKTNNCVSNLEWCSIEYNNTYGTRIERISKPVYCVELDRVFKSQVEAARELGLDDSSINHCLKGKQKTCGGYHWKYAEMPVKES